MFAYKKRTMKFVCLCACLLFVHICEFLIACSSVDVLPETECECSVCMCVCVSVAHCAFI